MTQAEKMFVVKASTMKLGATRAHNLYSKMKGGAQYVHGTIDDFKNHIRDVNAFIRESDAQILINKMKNRKKFVPNFKFQYKVENSELVAMFWADEVDKCNYKEFGDIISFDATFQTNKKVHFEVLEKGYNTTCIEKKQKQIWRKNETIEKLTNEANYVVDECLFLLGKDEGMLATFVEQLKTIKQEVQVQVPKPPLQKIGDVIEDIYAAEKPQQNDVNNPQRARNKDGQRVERRKSGREIALKAKTKLVAAAAKQGTTTASATEQATTTTTAAEQGATTVAATDEATTTSIVSEEATNAS
nr:hypothetical protein [Tanacetum cinerariifolium]